MGHRRWRLLIGILATWLAAGTAWGQSLEDVLMPGKVIAGHAKYEQECGSCHLAYHPSLLPERSWKAMLADQHDHFGEDLGLSEATEATLLAFAAKHAAEHGESPVAWKINQAIPPTETPAKITETRYWQRRHRSLSETVWRNVPRSDCGACHHDAQDGSFTPGAIDIPSSFRNSQGKPK